MTARFKTILATIFLVLTIIPVIVFVFTQVQKHAIYNEMKEKLEHENLQTISIASNKIQWLHGQKEAMINGEMFDVKSFTQSNGITTLIGLFDSKEKELNKKTIAFTKEKQQQSSSTATSFMFIVFYDDANFTYQFKNITTSISHQAIYTKQLSSIYLDKNTPPPNFS